MGYKTITAKTRMDLCRNFFVFFSIYIPKDFFISST